MFIQKIKNSAFYTFVLFCALNSPLSNAAAPANDDPGSLIFESDTRPCQMEVRDSLHAISFFAGGPGMRGCEDTIKSIKFNNARSAATIELTSRMRNGKHNGCLDTGDFNFYFKLRTVKNGTTTPDIRLDSLLEKSLGAPVVPGVVLQERNVTDKNKVTNYLTCIKIITTE